jgi:hypothetical protein
MSWHNRFDLVVAGDSRTLIGISPQTMRKILPDYDIGNLGFIALIYSQEYLDYIRSTVRSPVKNRVIVIGFSPRSLLSKERPECFFWKWSKEARVPLRMELNRRSGWLQTLFRELSVGDFNIRFFEINHRYLMIFFKSGWVASRLFPENAKASKTQYRTLFLRNKIDEKLLEMIYRDTELWTREGIKVIGIRIPTSPGLYTIENNLSGFNEKIIRQKFERSGGVWLNPSISYFVAHDGSHLRYDSAVSYSKSLANELKKFLDKKR